jgi:hypothetical protein
MTLIREISSMAQEELSDRYPNTKTEITMVQSYYMPITNSTHYLIVAFVNNRSHTGSGNSANMAVNALMQNVEYGK